VPNINAYIILLTSVLRIQLVMVSLDIVVTFTSKTAIITYYERVDFRLSRNKSRLPLRKMKTHASFNDHGRTQLRQCWWIRITNKIMNRAGPRTLRHRVKTSKNSRKSWWMDVIDSYARQKHHRFRRIWIDFFVMNKNNVFRNFWWCNKKSE